MSAPHHELASAHLASLDEDWAQHIGAIGPCRLEATPTQAPYEALIRAVVYQLIHTKTGDAILARLLALYPGEGFPSPDALLATDADIQRACGLSMAKVASIRGIAQAAQGGLIPTQQEALRLEDEEVIARLTTLSGVGRWTAQMFLIYGLGRPDVFPVHDLGVRQGYQRLKGLSAAPTPQQLQALGLPMSPFRTAATWYLWRVPKPDKR